MYSPIKAKSLRGTRPLTDGKIPLEIDDGNTARVQDFWQWAFSDLINNTTRGVLAEYLVAKALGLPLKEPRQAWDNFDLRYQGVGVEVKSCAYHQAWAQKKMSTIAFNIRASQGWDSETNSVDPRVMRRAKIYVLCLEAEKDRDLVDVLDVSQWRFWVLSREFLDNRKRSQHSIGKASLLREVGEPVGFHSLRENVDRVLHTR